MKIDPFTTLGMIMVTVEEEAYKVSVGQKACKHVAALNEVHSIATEAINEGMQQFEALKMAIVELRHARDDEIAAGTSVEVPYERVQRLLRVADNAIRRFEALADD